LIASLAQTRSKREHRKWEKQMTEGALSMAGGHQAVDAREGEAAAGGPWGAESREVGPPRAERGAAGPQIAAAYRQGLGIEAIARRAGLPVREVYWLLGRENVAIRPARVARGTKPDTIELLRRIRRMREEGFTYKQIGRTCGIAPGTVGVMLSTFREVEL
jgi:hypothetical protein